MSTFETETTLTKVFEDQNGWFRIETADAGRLDTKDPALAREAYNYFKAGTTVRVQGKEQRVNKDGRWFTNRYLNGISEAGGAWGGGGFGDEIPKAEPRQEQSPQRDDEKEGRIVREVAAKLAVWTLPHLAEVERTPANQVRIAEFWRAYIYGGARAVGVAPLGGPAPPPEFDPREDTGAIFAGSNSGDFQHPADNDIPF